MKLINIILFFLFISFGKTQGEIPCLMERDTCPLNVLFSNPSFEDSTIIFNITPTNWTTCLNSPDTQPDTILAGQPLPTDGNSYLGLIAIAPSFNEGVSQLLLESLIEGQEYQFNIDLSYSTVGGSETAANIFIWIGDDVCEQNQLIFTSSSINPLWTTETVNFIPDENFTSISIFTNGLQGFGFNLGYTYLDNITSENCDRIFSSTNQTTQEESTVYPNPNNSGLLHIEWQGDTPMNKISLYDALGRLVKVHKSNSNQKSFIETSAYKSGWYILLIQNDEEILARDKILILN